MNSIWTCFNIIILGVATAVARESQQRRQTVRVVMEVPTAVVTPDGSVCKGMTVDLSSGGTAVTLEQAAVASPGDEVTMVFPLVVGDAELPATVVGNEGNVIRVQFDPLTIHEEEMLTMVLYSRADTWLGWGEAREVDRPLTSLGRILKLSMYGLGTTFRGLMNNSKRKKKKKVHWRRASSHLYCCLQPCSPDSPLAVPWHREAQRRSAPARTSIRRSNWRLQR